MEAFLVPVWAKWQLNMELRQKTAVLVVFGWVLCGSLDWLERRACAKSIQYDSGWLRWTVLSSHVMDQWDYTWLVNQRALVW